MIALLVLGLAPALSGTFFQGDGKEFSNSFVFLPGGRVECRFQRRSRWEAFTATYKVGGGKVRVTYPGPKDRPANYDEYQIISWGKATFLLADDEIAYFFYQMRHGWMGESKSWGGSDFIRNDVNRNVEAPTAALSGKPVLPKEWNLKNFNTPTYTVCTCGTDETGHPVNAGTMAGLASGTVLVGIPGLEIAYVDADPEKDQVLVIPMLESKIKAGLKLQASEPPYRWRALIKQIKAKKSGGWQCHPPLGSRF